MATKKVHIIKYLYSSVASDTPHDLIYDIETVRVVLKARENSMLLGGISGIVLGYSRLDGGAARARVGGGGGEE